MKKRMIAFGLLLLLAGCWAGRPVEVVAPDGSLLSVDGRLLERLAGLSEEGEEIPIDRVLWTAGHHVLERLVVIDAQGSRREFDWAAVAGDAWWPEPRIGRMSIGGEMIPVSRLEVQPPALLGQVQGSILDVAPTAARALGLPAPAKAARQGWEVARAEHVLLLFLDGFGYVRYSEAMGDGLIPNLAALGEPYIGLTVYPPCTSVGTAALLTGAPPQENGVDRRGIRTTEAETLLDVATAAGLQVVTVEGEALAFNLRNAEIELSGDRDGNGGTDDNVLSNALAAIAAGMPDLLYVHFHGIDDAGHTYGPGTPEEMAKIREVDSAVGQVIASVPEDTLILVFADHGQHRVEEEGRLGNHGQLIERDMFIPIFVLTK